MADSLFAKAVDAAWASLHNRESEGPGRDDVAAALVEALKVIRCATPKMRSAGASPNAGGWKGPVWSDAVGGAEDEMAGYVFASMIDHLIAESEGGTKREKAG